MDEIHLLTKDRLPQTLAQRIELLWAAYKRQDAVTHNAILAEEYHAVHPDGRLHPGKPPRRRSLPCPLTNNRSRSCKLCRSATMERSPLTPSQW